MISQKHLHMEYSGLLLTSKLLNQRFLLVKSPLVKFYGGHHDLVNHYGIYVSQMTMDMFLSVGMSDKSIKPSTCSTSGTCRVNLVTNPGSGYDKWNISMVICDTYIP
jgi:hypothetical protein